jgi:hypothetical protein
MFMTLGWAGCAWAAARIFAGESQRLWLLFGLFAGLALQGKHAMLFFLIAFFAGVAFSSQSRLLLTRWPWYGAGIAFLIALPNVIWEYTHHWATYELLSNIAKSDKNLVLGPWEYLKSNIDSLGSLTLLVWIPGLIWCLLPKGGRRFRALGWTWIFSASPAVSSPAGACNHCVFVRYHRLAVRDAHDAGGKIHRLRACLACRAGTDRNRRGE